jgi:ankyrin repeat protein
MKLHRLFKQGNNLFVRLSLIILILLTSSTLRAQTPTNFSGKWALDKTKSKLDQASSFMEGDEILEITQNSASITFVKTLIQKGSDDFISTETYMLDGKETIVKDDMGTTKKTVKWSDDKKILTITTIMTIISNSVSKDFLVADSYKLSDNGLTLTIQSYSKNLATGERTDNFVYNKK